MKIDEIYVSSQHFGEMLGTLPANSGSSPTLYRQAASLASFRALSGGEFWLSGVSTGV